MINKKNIKKLIILALLVIIVFGLLAIFLINRKGKIHKIDEFNYIIEYDNTWKSTKQEDYEIRLKHKRSDSALNIKITELEDDIQYKPLDELFDSLLYNIQQQNNEYKLIYKEKTKITKNKLDGYKILFEDNENQAAIYFYKQGNKTVLITYEALYSYFDILLDSANNIIHNFSIKEQTFDVISTINLDTKEINFTEQEDVVRLLESTKDWEIASSNYLVNYSIPSNFKSKEYNTQYGTFKFTNLSTDTSINLRTSILKCNIYEYLDREDSPNIYDESLNDYNKSKELVNKFRDEPLSYIYKNNYLTNNKITENITIVFELNNNHILVVDISSRGIGIPEKLVNMIKINKVENIASNVKIEKEDDFIIGKLKRFTDYNYEETEEITLKIPEKYKEIDKNNNLYKERNYVFNYNEKKQYYDYEIAYKIISTDIDSQLELLDKSINKEYGKYQELNSNKDLKLNNKKFIVYERGYTCESEDIQGSKYKYYVNENILFYELHNDSYLEIIIRANEKTINKDIMSKLTNFNVKIE